MLVELGDIGKPFQRLSNEAKTLLPPDERPTMKWNANPFVIDRASEARSEDDGTAFLLPYWMGRFHRLVP